MNLKKVLAEAACAEAARKGGAIEVSYFVKALRKELETAGLVTSIKKDTDQIALSSKTDGWRATVSFASDDTPARIELEFGDGTGRLMGASQTIPWNDRNTEFIPKLMECILAGPDRKIAKRAFLSVDERFKAKNSALQFGMLN